MNKKSLLELLYDKNFRLTLKYMRRYSSYMRNGIDPDLLSQILEYDYELYIEKQYKKRMVDITSSNAVYKLNEIENISTNIQSTEDALCKFKALSLAKENLFEE